MKSLLMKTWWNWRPGERKDKREEVTEQPNRFRMREMTRDFLYLRRNC